MTNFEALSINLSFLKSDVQTNKYIHTKLIIGLVFSKTIDQLIEAQISEWHSQYNDLDIDKDGFVSIDEFASGHKNIASIIGDQFFDGAGKINFDQYCLYMVLFSEPDLGYKVNEYRIKSAYDEYCKLHQPRPNGMINISDFLEKNNDLLKRDQFENILTVG